MSYRDNNSNEVYGQQQVGNQLISGGAARWLAVNNENWECSENAIWSLTLKNLHRFNASSKWQIWTVLLPKTWRHGVHDTRLAHGQGERVHQKARKDGENPSCLNVGFSKASWGSFSYTSPHTRLLSRLRTIKMLPSVFLRWEHRALRESRDPWTITENITQRGRLRPLTGNMWEVRVLKLSGDSTSNCNELT